MRRAFAFVALLLLSGCDGTDDPGTPASWTARADEAFAEGDRLAAVPSSVPDAVAAWRRAGSAYMKAFRLEDPVAEFQPVRALLAFRIGRSWSQAARLGTDARQRGMHAERALFWLAYARRLEPTLRAVLFERARLFDSDIEEVRDPTLALEAYQAYVAAMAEVGVHASTGDDERVSVARARIEALGAPR